MAWRGGTVPSVLPKALYGQKFGAFGAVLLMSLHNELSYQTVNKGVFDEIIVPSKVIYDGLCWTNIMRESFG